MHELPFPVIDPVKTGKNIRALRIKRGLSVKQLQQWFQFQEPRAIYKWQNGQSLPSIDNLYALSILFKVPMNEILIPLTAAESNKAPQDSSCGVLSTALIRRPVDGISAQPAPRRGTATEAHEHAS